MNRLAKNQMLLFLENQEQLQAYDNRFPWSVLSIKNYGVASCSDYSHGKTTPAEKRGGPQFSPQASKELQLTGYSPAAA